MQQSREQPSGEAPPTAPRGVRPIVGWLDVAGAAATDTRSIVRDHERFFVEGSPTEDGVSALERQAAAFCAAVINRHVALVDHYHARLKSVGASKRLVNAIERADGSPDLVPRMVAILRYVRVLADGPRAIRCSHFRLLQDHGLELTDIVALTRLITFVNYQAGLLAGLDLLQGA